MKKYTIKDKSGTKKTIYAKDLAHALTFVDSKAGGFDYPDNENEADITWNNGLYIGKKAGYNRYAVSKKSGSKYLVWGVYSPKELDKLHLTEDSIKDDVVSNYFYFDLNDLSMSLDNAINIMKSCGLTIVKIDKRSKEAKVYYKGTSAAEQKAADKLDISLDDSINDSKAKDEANLPTTLQALVNDEEAAIKAYEVAIKNLEGKIDETQMQVLINIMKDERRHVENLYAILNGQVTEKNLEDSIHDSYVEVPLSLNRFEINAIQKNWFDIKETGKKEDGYPVYRLTGNKEKLLQWLRNNYDRSFSSSNIHDSTTTDLFKAIDKLYAKYGDLDVLSNTDLDNAIKELATTLPNVRYDDFKNVVENFIGERRLRERMKRSGLTYFKR